jgi:hypothetical protein
MKYGIPQSSKQLRPNNARQRERNLELARVETGQNIVSGVCRRNLFACHTRGHPGIYLTGIDYADLYSFS